MAMRCPAAAIVVNKIHFRQYKLLFFMGFTASHCDATGRDSTRSGAFWPTRGLDGSVTAPPLRHEGRQGLAQKKTPADAGVQGVAMSRRS